MNKPAPKEPSMDEILSSIRQIIADDDAAAPKKPAGLGTSPLVAPALGQGVTTSSITGRVTDTEGNPLAEATVVAIHVPSGTRYRAIVRPTGAFDLPNLRVGGPYTITASFIGMEQGVRRDVFLELGQPFRADRSSLARRSMNVGPCWANRTDPAGKFWTNTPLLACRHTSTTSSISSVRPRYRSVSSAHSASMGFLRRAITTFRSQRRRPP